MITIGLGILFFLIAPLFGIAPFALWLMWLPFWLAWQAAKGLAWLLGPLPPPPPDPAYDPDRYYDKD